MITTDQILAFGAVALVLIAIPGPSVVFTIGRALAHGRRIALLTVFGNSLGLLTVVVLVSVGLGKLVATSDAVFNVLRYGGAAYLIWLGISTLRHGKSVVQQDVDALAIAEPTLRPLTAIRHAWVVGATNPKGYVILGVLLPQFVDRSRGQESLQMFLLGLVAFAIGLLSDSLWALLASQLRDWLNRSPRRGRALSGASGLSMIGLGVATAATGRSS